MDTDSNSDIYIANTVLTSIADQNKLVSDPQKNFLTERDPP